MVVFESRLTSPGYTLKIIGLVGTLVPLKTLFAIFGYELQHVAVGLLILRWNYFGVDMVRKGDQDLLNEKVVKNYTVL